MAVADQRVESRGVELDQHHVRPRSHDDGPRLPRGLGADVRGADDVHASARRRVLEDFRRVGGGGALRLALIVAVEGDAQHCHAVGILHRHPVRKGGTVGGGEGATSPSIDVGGAKDARGTSVWKRRGDSSRKP